VKGLRQDARRVPSAASSTGFAGATLRSSARCSRRAFGAWLWRTEAILVFVAFRPGEDVRLLGARGALPAGIVGTVLRVHPGFADHDVAFGDEAKAAHWLDLEATNA